MDQLLCALGDHNFVFVVGEAGLSGFVAPSDLERHAARSHFQLLISGIEMLLAQIVRAEVAETVVERAIRPQVAKRWHGAIDAGQETHPVEYLYISELAALFTTTRLATPDRGFSEAQAGALHQSAVFETASFTPISRS